MAALSQTTDDKPSTKEVFVPQETLDHPFDVALVVKDGKEFKTHRRVLSEASPFFEKLFNSDTKESIEGVARLEMITACCLGDILEFIYTGSVQITTEDDAQELIVMADYLILTHLKTLAEKVLVNNTKLNASIAISTYNFAKRYGCEELSRSFILENFNTVAKMKDFLNLSSEEAKILISSDEINVSTEEDVFKIILTWIDHEKNERKKHFAELFREVRLVYVSHDFLYSNIVTNDFVNDNEGCIDLVRDALKSIIDSKGYHHLSILEPRKSLVIPVLVVRAHDYLKEEDKILCYNPRQDSWSRFRGPIPPGSGEVVSWRDELYFVARHDSQILRYVSISNRWMPLEFSLQLAMTVEELFIRNENEIYAWMSETTILSPYCASTVFKVRSRDCRLFDPYKRAKRISFIAMYKPETDRVTSFDLGSREGVCVVAKDNFIYFVGGRASPNRYDCERLWYADRYDLSTNTWDKIADLQEPRSEASGAGAHGKIFVAGGGWYSTHSCEMYNETTNTWQYTKGLPPFYFLSTLTCLDGKLYHVKNGQNFHNDNPGKSIGIDVVQSYDPDSNQWKEITQIPLRKLSIVPTCPYRITWYSMRVLNVCNYFDHALSLGDKSSNKRKCSIM